MTIRWGDARRRAVALALMSVIALTSLIGGTALRADDYDDALVGLDHKTGLIDTYIDRKKGRVILSLKRGEAGDYGRYIYAALLTGGLGSNPVGLDRSLPSDSHVLAFRRAGATIIAVIENSDFRASSPRASEQRAVRTSFAESVIWSGKIMAERGDDVLVDFSSFLLRDAVGVAARLKARGQGTYKIAADRSFVRTAAALIFTKNLEFDATITFAGSAPGVEIRATTPAPNSISLVAHTTLMALPEPGYVTRRLDPRMAMIGTSHVDMSAPLEGDVVQRLARRFRLELDADGKVVKPIIFYVDHGAPEPIRSALVEGANWWSTAFEKAGFPGGYRVEVLPEHAHPLDARYNVINWVHRATRGWSYGAALYDPRTGETLRGVVLLGSLRVRQDIKIFESLMGSKASGQGGPNDPIQIALARLRQLSAHEVGHALGFAHNMAASTYGERASVMDYPAPDIRLDGARFDASNAYGVGVGSWDDFTVRTLYGDYAKDDISAQDELIKQADTQGLIYVSDGDSRSVGTGNRLGALWDTGTDAIKSLKRHMTIRALALDAFDDSQLKPGESAAGLQTRIVPLYLYHRYQVQAAVKAIGGYDFQYRSGGDGRKSATIVPFRDQVAALDAVLDTLTIRALRIPDKARAALSPVEYDWSDPQFSRERFRGRASAGFDVFAAASTAIDISLEALLHGDRLERIHVQSIEAPANWNVSGYLSNISSKLVNQSGRGAYDNALARLVVSRYVAWLEGVMSDARASDPVLAAVRDALAAINVELSKRKGEDLTHARLLMERIENSLLRERTPAAVLRNAPAIPPGSPIGSSGSGAACWHCYPD